NDIEREHVVKLLGGPRVRVTAVATGEQALATLREQRFDCLVLDLKLPDVPGMDLVEKIKTELQLRDLPVIVYTGMELTPQDEARLQGLAEKVIPKDALDRLREETGAFLHRIAAARPHEEAASLLHRAPAQQPRPTAQVSSTSKTNAGLAGKKVLVVDDDVRNL